MNSITGTGTIRVMSAEKNTGTEYLCRSLRFGPEIISAKQNVSIHSKSLKIEAKLFCLVQKLS
jgi:hypothetical protein